MRRGRPQSLILKPQSFVGSILTFALLLSLLFMTAVAPSASAANVQNGKELYQERCVLCHGAGGRGWDWGQKMARPPVPVPNLLEVVPQRSDAYLRIVVRDGGEAVGLTRFMPAFGFNMNAQDVKDVVAYLRSLSRQDK